MKKHLKLLPAMFAFLAFAACSKDDDAAVEPTPEPEPAAVGINSFGFYASDNPDVLFEDYVTESISGTSIDIPLPEDVEVNNLIARFTTTEGDVVSVQGATQISGETANDFSSPLEYLVNEDDTNTIYTVSVSKMASAIWSQLPIFDGDLVNYLSLDIHPETYMPYVAFISEREESADEKLNLIGYDGTAWNRVGNADFSDGRARSIDLAFSNSGDPYVSFGDDSGDQTEAGVMTYNSGSWSYVGDGPFSGLRSSVNAVSVGENDEVYGFYINDQIGHANRRGVELKTFNGTWNDLPITGRTGFARVLRTKIVDGDVYLGVLDYGEGQAVSVYKYSNGTWSTLADKMKESEESSIYHYDFSMDVDSDGNVFVAYVESSPETSWQHKVRKYSAEEGNWSNVGDVVHTTESSITIRSFAVAVDRSGNPMLLYKNETEHPIVAHFDPDTNNWGASNSIGSVEADELKLQVAPNGIAYATYVSGEQLHVYKFDSPDNN